jgi:hypothetical protein
MDQHGCSISSHQPLSYAAEKREKGKEKKPSYKGFLEVAT